MAPRMSYRFVIICMLRIGSSEIPQIPDDIGELCPYSNICNHTAKKIFQDTDREPCCRDCSCDAQCGLQLNCCFDELDTYRLVEMGLVACIKPVSGNENIVNVQTYYMVQTCQESEKRPCKTRDEFGNSLIAPVSSATSSNIYVNKDCAQCNKETNIKEWDVVFVSNLPFAKYAVNWYLEVSLDTNNFAMVYISPKNEDWSMRRCYQNFRPLGECKDDTWKSLCKNLIAPYTMISGPPSQNVYCRKCSANNRAIIHDCASDPYRAISASTFSVLLNKDVLDEYTSKITKPKPLSFIRNICVDDLGSERKRTCFQTYCPEGQMYTSKGCSYFGLRWITAFYIIQIKLVPSLQNVPFESMLLAMETSVKSDPFRWLKPPCAFNNFTNMYVYYETAEETLDDISFEKRVKSFVVRLLTDTRIDVGFDPSKTLPLLSKCLKNKWLIFVNGTKYMFKASFDDYIFYVQDGNERLLKEPRFDDSPYYQKVSLPVIYKPLVPGPLQSSTLFMKSGIRLTKTYFCQQVRIPMSDIIVDYGQITILSINVTLTNNMYSVNYDYNTVSMNETTISVCLDDYITTSEAEIHPGNTFIAFISLMMFMVAIL